MLRSRMGTRALVAEAISTALASVLFLGGSGSASPRPWTTPVAPARQVVTECTRERVSSQVPTGMPQPETQTLCSRRHLRHRDRGLRWGTWRLSMLTHQKSVVLVVKK